MNHLDHLLSLGIDLLQDASGRANYPHRSPAHRDLARPSCQCDRFTDHLVGTWVDAHQRVRRRHSSGRSTTSSTASHHKRSQPGCEEKRHSAGPDTRPSRCPFQQGRRFDRASSPPGFFGVERRCARCFIDASDGVETHLAGDTLQVMVSAIRKLESRAGHQVVQHPRYQHFPGGRGRHHPRTRVHDNPAQRPSNLFGLTNIQTRSHLDSQLTHRV